MRRSRRSSELAYWLKVSPILTLAKASTKALTVGLEPARPASTKMPLCS